MKSHTDENVIRRLSRRSILRLAGLGSATGVLGTLWGGRVQGASTRDTVQGVHPDVAGHAQNTMGVVGQVSRDGFDPGAFLRSWNFSHLPEPERSRWYRETPRADGTTLREYEIVAVDREIEIAPGVYFPAWTFNGQVPGPTLRATETHELRVITDGGVTFDHEIAVAVPTPKPSGRFFGLFALIGVYVGVLPVLLGLAWYPLVRRLGRRGLDFVLALTVGLLVFLLVDSTHEGLEIAAEIPGSYQGVVLFVLAAALAFVAIELLGARLRSGGERAGGTGAAWATALLVAVGIGLHNFAEGLAIGSAFALGEAALGTLLILGFTLHNTTEGLAIVAPLGQGSGREDGRAGEPGPPALRTLLGRLVVLGLVAGAPTIAGTWLGGFVYSPVWSVVFLAVGAGAIAQVVAQVARGMTTGRSWAHLLRSGSVAAGLVAGIAVMYATGMMVG
ncbi:MAG: hypothetical protein ACLF0P_05325 [Thermoanaerobaculia bacterium]